MVEVYLGQISPFAGSFAIRGSATCDGQLLSIQQNTALFAIIGTTYGGNGVNTFQLPDLRGRSMLSQGQGPGLSLYTLGEIAGVEHTTMTINNMPSHNHPITGSLAASTTAASMQAPAAGSVLGAGTDISSNTKKALPAIYCPAGTTANVPLGGLNVASPSGSTGGGQPFANLGPYLTITMLIWLQGIFPSRN